VDLVAVATYDPEPTAPAAARRFVRETLRSWKIPGSDELAADAELLTSELVTNAVMYAGTPVQVTCRADSSEVEVSVLDWQPARTITGCPDRVVPADRIMGRGLLLAAALSSLWGVTYGPAAKAVWFRLRPDGAASADPAACTAPVTVAGDGAGQAGSLPLERARLSQDDRDWRGRISFLAEASDLLAGTLDQEQAIALAAQLVVPRLAAWCAVLLAGGSGQLTPAYVWHADETRNDALSCLLSRVPPPQEFFPQSWLQWSLSVPSGQAPGRDAAELVNDPVWCFPMLARGHSLGVLALGRPNELLGWPAVDLAGDLARRVALALDNARLYTDQLRASHALQRTLLPPQLPVIPGLDIAAGYQAAGEGNEVGGDFYDVFQVGPDRWRFAIGDVCGKGMEAASVTGLTRHALRILAREGHDIPAVLERLNSIILEEGSAVPFLTLIHGEIMVMPSQTAVSMVCAGHPLPLLLRSRGGTQAVAVPQLLIGVMDGATFRADTCRLRPGDMLLCVTDGVTERRAGDRMLDDGYGLQKLLRDCSGLNAGAAVARIQREVLRYGSDPPADDIALLVFRGT
jgi:serine phosphatase RsbU (regulator of sigma subunit)/anti-sigma regulatory factor (Ser/Thr protein kinase)